MFLGIRWRVNCIVFRMGIKLFYGHRLQASQNLQCKPDLSGKQSNTATERDWKVRLYPNNDEEDDRMLIRKTDHVSIGEEEEEVLFEELLRGVARGL